MFTSLASVPPVYAIGEDAYPVDIRIEPHTRNRNRLTSAFRPILAIPHILLVGGPGVVAFAVVARDGADPNVDWTATTGALGAVAGVIAIIAWFWIVFTGKFPEGLRTLSLLYLRWRVRAVAYLMLLTDDYPPFGDGDYPAELLLGRMPEERNRVSVAFRIFLILPHLILISFLSVVWMFTTLIAWANIIVRGTFPVHLFSFGKGVLRWTTRVESYLLLLHDDYPPFSFD
jgi:hypothetical protein